MSINNMTFIKTMVFTVTGFVVFASPVMAMTVTPNPTRVMMREERLTERTELKKDRALAEIDRRVKALTALTTRVGTMRKVTTEQKANLTGNIGQEIAALTSLRAKIEEDTDLATLTADKKSIVDSYRVYVLFIPQVTIVAHADQVLTLVDELKAKTTDAGALTKLTEAATLAQKAITNVLALTPEGYPGNQSAVVQARADLKTARADLRSAWGVIKKK